MEGKRCVFLSPWVADARVGARRKNCPDVEQGEKLGESGRVKGLHHETSNIGEEFGALFLRVAAEYKLLRLQFCTRIIKEASRTHRP